MLPSPDTMHYCQDSPLVLVLPPVTLGGSSDGKWRTPETEQCGDSGHKL